MDINASLAAPLVLLFIIGYTLTGGFICMSKSVEYFKRRTKSPAD